MSELMNTLDDLRGIWQYGALDLHAQEGKKTEGEYELILMKLWDKLDTLPLPEVEGVIVELEGMILGIVNSIIQEEWAAVVEKREPDVKFIDKLKKEKPKLKGLLTNIEEYLGVRTEQDETT